MGAIGHGYRVEVCFRSWFYKCPDGIMTTAWTWTWTRP
jgi:hypothetical protein